jgi:hypothetical protein
MHDINPLGPLMHLRELERQATASKLRHVRSKIRCQSYVTAAWAAVILLVSKVGKIAGRQRSPQLSN